MSTRAAAVTLVLHLMTIGAFAPAAVAERIDFTGTLKGTEEVPPVETEAQGEAEAHYDTETRHLSWTIVYSGLSGPATGVHFHGPARPRHSADLELPVMQALESPIEGEADL